MARVNEDKYWVDFYYINVKHRYNMQNITTKVTIIGIGGKRTEISMGILLIPCNITGQKPRWQVNCFYY